MWRNVFSRFLSTIIAAAVLTSCLCAHAATDHHWWLKNKGEQDFTAARTWNEELLFAIRRATARPVVHARNLFHSSVCMWDIWAAYDPNAEGYLVKEKLTPPANPADLLAAREEAISYACYRLLSHRFQNSPNAEISLEEFDLRMADLGYDTAITTTEGNSPAAFGNRVAAAVIAWGLTDNSNEQENYAANNGYEPMNGPLVVDLFGNPICAPQTPFDPEETCMRNPNHWQPLALEFFVGQSGIFLGEYPDFLGPHWGYISPFALRERNRSETGVHLDPGPFPHFGTDTHDEYVTTYIRNIELSSWLDPDDGQTMDISPASFGNNPLGTNDGTGYDVNPATGQPYEPQIVKRGDWARVIAEFWADGPDSETPPGHWNTLANYVSDTIEEKRIGGEGPIVADLEWDVKLYFALNGTLHDAAIGAWGAKGYYDSPRPISAIRYLCEVGQSSFPEEPNYDPLGMPLIPGLIELVTVETTAVDERHEHLAGEEGKIAVLSWVGAPEEPEDTYTGVDWILCGDWVPYQRPSFVSPPFGGYISGHSTYSRSAAEIMTAFTGTKFFPGGMGTWPAPQNEFLVFEDGPSEDIELQWATYQDASDQCSVSRQTGGIHPPLDDIPGRLMGFELGMLGWREAQEYWDGTASYHSADTSRDHIIDLSELLRAIQLFGFGGYDCAQATEDGYAPTTVKGQEIPGECYPHDGDYAPDDFKISLNELLRLVQYYNVGAYDYCIEEWPPTEDNFRPALL
jgi:hypothetical protein